MMMNKNGYVWMLLAFIWPLMDTSAAMDTLSDTHPPAPVFRSTAFNWGKLPKEILNDIESRLDTPARRHWTHVAPWTTKGSEYLLRNGRANMHRLLELINDPVLRNSQRVIDVRTQLQEDIIGSMIRELGDADGQKVWNALAGIVMTCARLGDLETMQLILGAPLEQGQRRIPANVYGNGPARAAVISGHWAVVEALVSRWHINVDEIPGWPSLLSLAIIRGKEEMAVRLVRDLGMDPRPVIRQAGAENMVTFLRIMHEELHHDVSLGLLGAVFQLSVDACEYLLADDGGQVDPNIRYANEEPLLLTAIPRMVWAGYEWEDCERVVALLLKHGADLARGSWEALTRAINYQRAPLVQLMLESIGPQRVCDIPWSKLRISNKIRAEIEAGDDQKWDQVRSLLRPHLRRDLCRSD